jgi:hypothetical protein
MSVHEITDDNGVRIINVNASKKKNGNARSTMSPDCSTYRYTWISDGRHSHINRTFMSRSQNSKSEMLLCRYRDVRIFPGRRLF